MSRFSPAMLCFHDMFWAVGAQDDLTSLLGLMGFEGGGGEEGQQGRRVLRAVTQSSMEYFTWKYL